MIPVKTTTQKWRVSACWRWVPVAAALAGVAWLLLDIARTATP